MRALTLLGALALGVNSTACGPKSVATPTIVGRFVVTSASEDADGSRVGQRNTTPKKGTSIKPVGTPCSGIEIDINQDGSFTWVTYESKDHAQTLYGTWAMEGKQLELATSEGVMVLVVHNFDLLEYTPKWRAEITTPGWSSMPIHVEDGPSFWLERRR